MSREHVASIKSFVFVWIALLALALATAGSAYIPMGPFNAVVHS